VDALFETVSGFTTTGASILSDVESLSRSLVFWRSFTHFLGGMGVLVFVLAIVPMAETYGGNSLDLLRAESTGPQVGKILPKMRESAKMLYIIYIVMTVIMIVFLLAGGMSLFDSLTTAFGTAGTGGFGIKNDSMAGYSTYLQIVTGVFMLLFGVNFNIYFLLLVKEFKKAFFNEEMRVYFAVMAAAVGLIAINLVTAMGRQALPSVNEAFFQVSSVMTTTGFSTVDFNLWPAFSKGILLLLMILGACAGSTGGGIKIVRSIILVKSAKNNMMRTLRPLQVNRVMLDGRAVDEETVSGVYGFMTMYSIIAVASILVVSLDGFSVETNISAVMATLNNIGPGLDAVGPLSNFGDYSVLSKIVLSLNMLIGRLELFPMLLLFTTSVWRKGR
jgi:trk system potassium uptake protein TrkH